MFEKDINAWLNQGYSYEDIATEFSNRLNEIQKEREKTAVLARKRELMRDFLEAVQSYVLEFCGDCLDADLIGSLQDPITDEDVDKVIIEIDNAIQVISKGLSGLDSIVLSNITTTPTPAPASASKIAKPLIKRTPASADDIIQNWMAKHNL